LSHCASAVVIGSNAKTETPASHQRMDTSNGCADQRR
jgi:hypothetical protein